MENFTEFIAIPAIVVIAYFVGMIVKALCTDPRVDNLIPVICGGTGLILAVLAYFTAPGLISADNWITAVAIGIVSGLAATGANQIYKQINKWNR